MDEVMRGDTAEELDVRCPETAKQRCGPVKRKRNSHAAPPTPQPLEAEGLMKAATIAAKSMSNLVRARCKEGLESC